MSFRWLLLVQAISFYQRKGFEAEDFIYHRKRFLRKMLSQNVMQSRLRHSCLNYTRQIEWIEQEMLIVCLRIVVSTHIVLCFCFVYLRLVYPMLPVSQDCLFVITPAYSVTRISIYMLYINIFKKNVRIIRLWHKT